MIATEAKISHHAPITGTEDTGKFLLWCGSCFALGLEGQAEGLCYSRANKKCKTVDSQDVKGPFNINP